MQLFKSNGGPNQPPTVLFRFKHRIINDRMEKSVKGRQFKHNLIWGHPDIPIPYVLLPVIPLPDIPIPDMPKIKIDISIMFAVFLPNIPIPDIYTGF